MCSLLVLSKITSYLRVRSKQPQCDTVFCRYIGRHQWLWGPTRELSLRAASEHIIHQLEKYNVAASVLSSASLIFEHAVVEDPRYRGSQEHCNIRVSVVHLLPYFRRPVARQRWNAGWLAPPVAMKGNFFE
ncbi:hypothetical protein E2C01_076043 [Portunus trituberculatus]|uniref:Uncharacterized protein n=1 Tax=Portunus trituberculatus TaxID=210409 RepID=A0A5B7IIQ4_PORTR|nr:hypothetical protein [Portunus trituberculatus]